MLPIYTQARKKMVASPESLTSTSLRDHVHHSLALRFGKQKRRRVDAKLLDSIVEKEDRKDLVEK